MSKTNQSPGAPAATLQQTGRSVRLSGLSKHYGDFAAVDGIDMDIRAGELLTLLGASGSGKTTTLSMIAGFTTPTEGTVLIDGEEITRVPPHKRNLGMVFQHYSLFPHMNVRTNVEFPLKQRGVPKAERRRRAMEALEVVELAHRAQARVTELSGGQQQRIALARALVFSPSVLLMDEPFGALDRALREKMQMEVRRIHRELGVTVVFVTHDQQEALTLSDRIAVFERGRIEQVGTPEDLYERPASLHVATFLGESNLLPGTVDGGVFVTRSGSRLSAGSAENGPATLVVRPEHVRVQPATGTGAGIAATVGEVVYLGADKRLVAVTADGEITARIAAAEGYRPGDDVRLGWEPGAAAVFPG
ncbi:ABC transporter ATP-binding protein [Sediminivirga luteola]|uniref:ABC transporter ATP-binding protein n=1 Tax=Sediminivirga luteola TaxID=1774748 RepID=A0A8J2TVS4_9MICO|nr:ABC transporter ATP-binding protein [Sediminivirga luteola]GGA05389.1 ABC transporter ATP-binding protein [Sediminivirga luteola]